jgi:hypothetical protein
MTRDVREERGGKWVRIVEREEREMWEMDGNGVGDVLGERSLRGMGYGCRKEGVLRKLRGVYMPIEGFVRSGGKGREAWRNE